MGAFRYPAIHARVRENGRCAKTGAIAPAPIESGMLDLRARFERQDRTESRRQIHVPQEPSVSLDRTNVRRVSRIRH
jgi:hypothetical protein